MQGRKNNVRLRLGRRKAADTHKQGETSLKGCGHSANQGTNQSGGSSASLPTGCCPHLAPLQAPCEGIMHCSDNHSEAPFSLEWQCACMQ